MTAAMEPGQRAYLARWEGFTLGPRGAAPHWVDLQPCAREIWARVEQACIARRGERIAQSVVQRVCDFDDRTSPEDQPDMLLVTAEELQALIVEEVEASTNAAGEDR